MTRLADGSSRFEELYNHPSPERYYRTVAGLDYTLPTEIQRDLRAAVALSAIGPAPEVVDLASSYGTAALLANHDLSLRDVYDHYRSSSYATGYADAVATDRAWLGAHAMAGPMAFTGVDIAGAAIRYTLDVGLHVAGSDEDLGAAPASPPLAERLRRAAIVLFTGAFGYVDQRFVRHAFGRDVLAPDVVVVASAVRTADPGRRFQQLVDLGFVVEQRRRVHQRRTQDAEEHRLMLTRLAAAGLDPEPEELDGWYLAENAILRRSAPR